MSTAYTFYWSDIFPTYSTFVDFVASYEVIDLNEEGEPYPFLLYVYKILSRTFWNMNIRYTDPNAFCRALANVLENRYKQFQKQKEMIDAMYKLTPEELAEAQEALTNYADNPNTMPEDPTKPLKYISSQSYARVSSNKLKAYYDALNAMPNLRIDEFIRGRASYRDEISFLDLFMNIQPNIDYYYNVED